MARWKNYAPDARTLEDAGVCLALIALGVAVLLIVAGYKLFIY